LRSNCREVPWSVANAHLRIRATLKELFDPEFAFRKQFISVLNHYISKELLGESKEAQLFRLLSRQIPEDLYEDLRQSSAFVILPHKTSIRPLIEKQLGEYMGEHKLEILMSVDGQSATFNDLKSVYSVMHSSLGLNRKVVQMIHSHDGTSGGVLVGSVFARCPTVEFKPNSLDLGVAYCVGNGSDSATNVERVVAPRLNAVFKEAGAKPSQKNDFPKLVYNDITYVPRLLLDWAAVKSSFVGDSSPPGYSLTHGLGKVSPASMATFSKAAAGDRVSLEFGTKSRKDQIRDGYVVDDGVQQPKYVVEVLKCSHTIKGKEYIYGDCRKEISGSYVGVIVIDKERLSIDFLMHGKKRVVGTFFARLLRARMDGDQSCLEEVDRVMSSILGPVWCWKDCVKGSGASKYVQLSFKSEEDDKVCRNMSIILDAFKASEGERAYGNKLVELLDTLKCGPVVRQGKKVQSKSVQVAITSYLKTLKRLVKEVLVLREGECGIFVGGVYDHLFFCHLVEMEEQGIREGGLLAWHMNMEGIEALNGLVMKWFRHNTSKNEKTSVGGALPARTQAATRKAFENAKSQSLRVWNASPKGKQYAGSVGNMNKKRLLAEARKLNVKNLSSKNVPELRSAVLSAKANAIKTVGVSNVIRKKGLWKQAENGNRYVQILKLMLGKLIICQIKREVEEEKAVNRKKKKKKRKSPGSKEDVGNQKRAIQKVLHGDYTRRILSPQKSHFWPACDFRCKGKCLKYKK